MKPLSTIFFLIILLLACKNSNTIKPLPLDTMKVVMWELLNADEWNNMIMVKDTLQKNSKLNLQFYQQIFAKHAITKEHFYQSYNYFDAQPDKMKVLFDSLTVYAERKKKGQPQKKDTTLKKP